MDFDASSPRELSAGGARAGLAGIPMLALDPAALGDFWFDGIGLVSADTMLDAEPPADIDSLLCLFRITTRPLSGICAPHPYSRHAYVSGQQLDWQHCIPPPHVHMYAQAPAAEKSSQMARDACRYYRLRLKSPRRDMIVWIRRLDQTIKKMGRNTQNAASVIQARIPAGRW